MRNCAYLAILGCIEIIAKPEGKEYKQPFDEIDYKHISSNLLQESPVFVNLLVINHY